VKKESIKPVRCAIYTRVSTEHGLEQDFNSLDAQHDAAQAYIRSLSVVRDFETGGRLI
jgi:site-specific DNA recombinase